MFDVSSLYPPTADEGHKALIHDLYDLLHTSMHFEFHDFRNTKYATPKVELRNQLLKISNNVIDGKYDNEPTQ